MYIKINKDLIEKKADFLTEKYTLEDKTEGYVDVIEIAKSNGFMIGNASITDDSDSFIAINENVGEIFGKPTSKLIVVNVNRSIEYKRFIIAHELGHYFLHYVDNVSNYNGMYIMKKYADHKDTRYTFFAECLLMPRKIFTERFNQLKKEPSVYNIALSLSKEFKVTQLIAEKRIKELGLVL